jgi:hypothetical protein
MCGMDGVELDMKGVDSVEMCDEEGDYAKQMAIGFMPKYLGTKRDNSRQIVDGK